MNLNALALLRQVAHSPHIAAVVRHSAFETGWTAGRVLPAHTKNDAVRRFLYRFQNQLLRRRQRTPHKINMLAHTFSIEPVKFFRHRLAPKVRKNPFK